MENERLHTVALMAMMLRAAEGKPRQGGETTVADTALFIYNEVCKVLGESREKNAGVR